MVYSVHSVIAAIWITHNTEKVKETDRQVLKQRQTYKGKQRGEKQTHTETERERET